MAKTIKQQFAARRNPADPVENYRGWTIEKQQGTQLGYATTQGRGGKGRKVSGWFASHPEHLPNGKLLDTLREAKEYIDQFMGEDTSALPANIDKSEIPPKVLDEGFGVRLRQLNSGWALESSVTEMDYPKVDVQLFPVDIKVGKDRAYDGMPLRTLGEGWFDGEKGLKGIILAPIIAEWKVEIPKPAGVRKPLDWRFNKWQYRDPVTDQWMALRESIWRYNASREVWEHQRDVSGKERETWLEKFRKDDPSSSFVIAYAKPKGKPKHETATPRSVREAAPRSVRFQGPPVRAMEGFALAPPEPRRCLTPRQIRPALEAIVPSYVEHRDPELLDRLAQRLADLSHASATLTASELEDLVVESTKLRPPPEIDWDSIPTKVAIFRVSTEGEAIRFLCPEFRDGTSWNPDDPSAIGRVHWILGHLGVDADAFSLPLIEALAEAQRSSTTALREMSEDAVNDAITSVFGREDFIPDYEALLRLLCESYVLVGGFGEYSTVRELADAKGYGLRYRFPEPDRARTAQGIVEYYSDLLQGWNGMGGPFGDLPARYIEGGDREEYLQNQQLFAENLQRSIEEFTNLAKKEQTKPAHAGTATVEQGRITTALPRPSQGAPRPKAPKAPKPKGPKPAPKAITPRGGWDAAGLARVRQIVRPELLKGKLDLGNAKGLISVYLQGAGWYRDSRSEFSFKHLEHKDERWNLAKRNVQHQVKRGGDWHNVLSEPVVQFAKALRDQVLAHTSTPVESGIDDQRKVTREDLFKARSVEQLFELVKRFLNRVPTCREMRMYTNTVLGPWAIPKEIDAQCVTGDHLRIDTPGALGEIQSIGLEREAWVKRQDADRDALSNPRGFWANLAAYQALEATKAEMGADASDLYVWDILPDAGFIEGDEGRVYTVLPDGSIALNIATASADKAALAKTIMLVA